jgi:hypothetical protein
MSAIKEHKNVLLLKIERDIQRLMSGDYFLDGGLAFDQFKSRRVEIDSP